MVRDQSLMAKVQRAWGIRAESGSLLLFSLKQLLVDDVRMTNRAYKPFLPDGRKERYKHMFEVYSFEPKPSYIFVV